MVNQAYMNRDSPRLFPFEKASQVTEIKDFQICMPLFLSKEDEVSIISTYLS